MPSMTIKPRADETGAFAWLQNLRDGELIHLVSDIEVGSLEHGMESGRPSVAFIFRLPDGKVVVAETSLRLFVAAARGLEAAHIGEL